MAKNLQSFGERFFKEYFMQAGVSDTWLARLRVLIRNHDLYQTGEALVKEESRVITDPLDNLVPRREIETPPMVGDFGPLPR
jgi:hypothetical protein